MSWITAILQLNSQVADLFGNVIVKRINIRLFDLLARFHYILNLPRISPLILPIASADRFVPICFILLSMLFRTSFTIALESDSVVSSTSWSVVGCIVMTGSSSLSLILISPGRGCFRTSVDSDFETSSHV